MVPLLLFTFHLRYYLVLFTDNYCIILYHCVSLLPIISPLHFHFSTKQKLVTSFSDNKTAAKGERKLQKAKTNR